MSVDCGLIDAGEMHAHLRLCLPDTRLESASVGWRAGRSSRPTRFPTRISLDDTAVYYPGSYSSGEDQGAPPNGPLPPVDDHFYFIHLAWALSAGLAAHP